MYEKIEKRNLPIYFLCLDQQKYSVEHLAKLLLLVNSVQEIVSNWSAEVLIYVYQMSTIALPITKSNRKPNDDM